MKQLYSWRSQYKTKGSESFPGNGKVAVSDDAKALAQLNKVGKEYTFGSGMIFHSDRGVQYASKATVNTLKSYSIVQSMSRKANCWDNAVAESFFKSLKIELIYGNKPIGAKQMRNRIFEYIEIWYRKQRRHSYLDYQTIEEFNQQYTLTFKGRLGIGVSYNLSTSSRVSMRPVSFSLKNVLGSSSTLRRFILFSFILL